MPLLSVEIAEIAVTEMQRVQSEYTHEHQETGCTLTFDKYLTLFAWLNKLFFVDFAATNETPKRLKKPAKDSVWCQAPSRETR